MWLQRVFTWQRAGSVWEWFRCKGKVRKSPAFVFLLGDAHKALPSKYYSLTWLRSDTPQTRPETILTSHIKYSRSWMWFLNKLGAVFSAETGIFLYYISRLHFHKRLKKWLCNEKKILQKQPMAENLWLWWCCSYTTVSLYFTDCLKLGTLAHIVSLV